MHTMLVWNKSSRNAILWTSESDTDAASLENLSRPRLFLMCQQDMKKAKIDSGGRWYVIHRKTSKGTPLRTEDSSTLGRIDMMGFCCF